MISLERIDIMTHVNIFESTAELFKFIKMIENREEDVIFISQNGTDVAQVTLLPKTDRSKYLGIAKETVNLPENFDEVFDSLDSEITELFENGGEL